MYAAFKFALNGENMEFAMYLIRDEHAVPAALFIDIFTEKCKLINRHLCDSRDHLMIMSSITNQSASIQFHDILFENSEFHRVTLSNLPDLEDQLVHLWTEVQDILHYYHINDHNAELASINTFYRNLAIDHFMQEGFIL